jgi:predicted Mrr-cat superfamily restriction endonuclease
MSGRAWVIKLGSGGRCVDFCERHGVVGLGWRNVEARLLLTASKDELFRHVSERCGWYKTNAQRAAATGQLYRFARECTVGDYVLYYDPPRKRVVVCEVTSDATLRTFEPEDPADIWHVRRVDVLRKVPILDFFGTLKGRILGPRMSFWELRPFSDVNRVARGEHGGTADPEIEAAYETLSRLVLERAKALDAKDWEALVADYFKAQGAHLDERIEGNRAIIDVEAVFDHGELGEELWRVQVKRYQDKPVDWNVIEKDLEHVGSARFCFVSVYGFTAEARANAEQEGVHLLEAGDFTRFLLGGKLRPALREKLLLPDFG